MINWLGVFSNALWIAGLALLLATLSYASWDASVARTPFWPGLGRHGYQIALNLAGLLFSSGLATTADRLLEISLWGVLGAIFLVRLIRSIGQYRKQPG